MTTERRVAARAGDQASMRRLSYVAPRELRWEDAPAPRSQASVEDAVDALLETGWTKLIIDCDSGRDILPGG